MADGHGRGCTGCLVLRFVAEVERLRAENQALRTALVAMVEDHPFVATGDDAPALAAWFVNRATQALTDSVEASDG